MTKSFSIMHLILAACGGLLLGFVVGGFAGKAAALEQARMEAARTQKDGGDTVALADSSTVTAPSKPATSTSTTPKPEAKTATKTTTTKTAATKTASTKTAPTLAKTTTSPTKTTKPVVAPKPAASTAPAAPTTAAAPKGKPAFSLVEEAKAGYFFSLNTFANGLEDVSVDLNGLEAWGGSLRDYAGTYQGGQDAVITRARIVPLATGRTNVVMSYSIEEYSNEGLAEEKTGDETAKGVAFANSVGTWKKTGRVYATRGQFVRWTQDGKLTVGLLLHGEHPMAPYVLLRKTGK